MMVKEVRGSRFLGGDVEVYVFIFQKKNTQQPHKQKSWKGTYKICGVGVHPAFYKNRNPMGVCFCKM